MSAESPRHVRSGGPLTVPPQPPSDRSIIDAVSGFINDVTLSSSSTVDPKDVIQWARFETADINEPTPEGDSDNDISPLLLILGYGSGVQVWLIPPSGDAQEVLSWRQGTVRVLRILPTPQHGDCFASKRPLIALCDSASPGPTFCSLSFISIRGGEQVKSIKFKNPILDVLANKRSVVVSFSERFAVFDAATLEDRMTVTTCYPCPCPLGGSAPINPLALGDRWLAYADKKLNQSKRSSGGCEGEGVTSYTATVLHAAKSLSKGLRGLGESVAHSLGGGRSTSQSPSPPNADMQQPGVVTILDIESSDDEDCQDEEPYDPIVAHFVAHSEAIIALQFDASGMLLVTADRRGHDFHVFRVNPHPCGPGLAAVHHLYILHRGDTTAKVQDIAVSWDSRWAAVSTLRGTTHVFAISAYGGAPAVRTHTQPRVVNRLSRFHRSAGLPIAAQHSHAQPVPKRNSGSPVGEGVSQGAWFPNPRLPPYPAPTTVTPLAQLRPTANLPTHTITRTSSGRQRLSSLSEDSNSAPLLARARFGMYVGGGVGSQRAAPPVTALYLQAASGALLHLLLHPRPAANIPKEKVCDESPIEVEVEAAAQWPLQRPAAPAAADLLAPLPPSNLLLAPLAARGCADMCMSEEERWLSQVEIVTHAGPHRRLWMGPQFVFKTYNCNGSSLSLSEAETVEVELSAARGVARSNPVNMPGARPIVPVLVDSGSASSLEQSPSEGRRRSVAEGRPPACDLQLREDLAEAMREDHGCPSSRHAEEEAEEAEEEREEARPRVARAVDPLGCVVAAPAGPPAPPPPDLDRYTRANDDEARFRPVVRAPAALPLPAAVLARPLPRSTTIPVQSLSPPDAACSPPAPHLHALTTDVVIPAALSRRWPDDDPLRSLPKSTRPPADIQPAARIRRKKSPTPTEEALDCVSCKTKCRDESEPTDVPKVADEYDYKKARDRSETANRIEPSVTRKVRDSSVSKERAEKSTVSAENMQCSVNKVVKEPSVKIEFEEPHLLREVSGTTVARKVREQSEGKEFKELSAGKEVKEPNARKESKELSSRKETKEPSTGKEVKESSGRKETKEPITEKEVKEPSARKETKEPSTGKEVKKPSARKEAKELSARKETKEPSTGKEVKESSARKETKEPSTGKEVKESSARKETKEPSTGKEVKEPSAGKEVKEPSAIREVRKFGIDTNARKLNVGKEDRERSVDSHVREPSVARENKTLSVTSEIRVPSEPKLIKETRKNKKYCEIGEVRDRSLPRESSQPKETKRTLETKESRQNKDPKNKAQRETILTTVEIDKDDFEKSPIQAESVTTVKDVSPAPMLMKLSLNKGTCQTKNKEWRSQDIKTEEQAWDMLLSEPEKPTIVQIDQQIVDEKGVDESKPKSKRNRKVKKAQDDLQTKTEEDSFIEIHTIEEKEQPSSGELVSISTPYEDIEPPSFYISKSKKSRSPKNTSDKSEESEKKFLNFPDEEEIETAALEPKNLFTFGDSSLEVGVMRDFSSVLKSKEKFKLDSRKENQAVGESSFFTAKELPKTKKSKSLSPYADSRNTAEKPLGTDVKDVYVIDTSKEDFPEIQITRGNKPRKRSPQPQPVDKKSSITEVPVKSWSSIAASKSVKKVEEVEKNVEHVETTFGTMSLRDELRDAVGGQDEFMESSNGVSLQDKLIELCKRTDIMVAECDAPSELNFVEEHHAVLHELPPLEPLDFGLDDFRLEVMRDSLLEINEGKLTSPICKINIDDILSSIKETTTKVIESSTFNLIDLEKVPAKREKGFSVVESHKITSQEVKLDDEMKSEEKDAEIMEKSSDDDVNSPPASTDSDKDDKKGTGATIVTLPSSKQSSKPKKSRRKKK